MTCQEEKQMLPLIHFLFQESQRSSCVANEPDSFLTPLAFQIRPEKGKQFKQQNGSGHERWRGGPAQHSGLPPEQ